MGLDISACGFERAVAPHVLKLEMAELQRIVKENKAGFIAAISEPCRAWWTVSIVSREVGT